ncbi:alcohol dehydrogenase [Hyaloraphidium curvatum]|nr:alcohol dehydrogenase [Hyaloraphidium curvatum]
MKAALLVENGKPLVLRDDLATPEPTGTQVLVETTFCGVCHSDLHIWEGKYDLGGGKVLDMQGRGLKLPLAMGHEVVGRVAKLGPDAKGVEVGAEYLVYPWVGCDNCALCRAGSSNMCLTPRSIGVYAGGGYATHVIVPNPSVLLPIPANVDKAVAATYACSGVTVYSAISKVKPLLTDPEEPLVLVGAGGLGLNAVSLLQALGHKYTVVMDIDEGRLKTAEKAGAKKTVDGRGSAEEVVKRIVEACGGTAPVAIIDLVNSSATAQAAFLALRKGGKLVQVGLFGGSLELPLPLMPIRALTIQGSYVGNLKELKELLDLAAKGGVQPLPVVTMKHPEEANEALEKLKSGGVTGRIVLKA